MRSALKKSVALSGKVLITSAALWWAFRKVDFASLLMEIRDVHPGWLLLAGLAFLLSKGFEALRLNLFFRCHAIALSELANAKLYLLGMFYNLFLPGGVGGDGYKVYWLKKNREARVSAVVSATVLSRINGIIAIGLLAIAFSYLLPPLIPPQKWVILLVAPGVFVYRFALTRYRGQCTSTVFAGLGHSIAAQAFQLLSALLILVGIGAGVDWVGYLTLFLLSGLVFVLPIFVGGAGSRELVFAQFAGFLGVSAETGIALSLLFFAVRAVVSGLGAYYLVRPERI